MDVVDGQPVYVRAPFATYTDTGYGAFTAAQAGRTPMLYVAGNDGMLHAFYAGTSLVDPQGGKEAWAMVPQPDAAQASYTLADANYKNVHQYFVDGTPYRQRRLRRIELEDPPGGAASTTAARGFYALDVSLRPAQPTKRGHVGVQLEQHRLPGQPEARSRRPTPPTGHLGLSFGHPLISKLSDGTWVVMVTSGLQQRQHHGADRRRPGERGYCCTCSTP